MKKLIVLQLIAGVLLFVFMVIVTEAIRSDTGIATQQQYIGYTL